MTSVEMCGRSMIEPTPYVRSNWLGRTSPTAYFFSPFMVVLPLRALFHLPPLSLLSPLSLLFLHCLHPPLVGHIRYLPCRARRGSVAPLARRRASSSGR